MRNCCDPNHLHGLSNVVLLIVIRSARGTTMHGYCKTEAQILGMYFVVMKQHSQKNSIYNAIFNLQV